MIDCAQYRRTVLADPHASSPELDRHLASCPDCPAYTQRLQRFEGRLAQALRVDPERSPRSARTSGRFRHGAPARLMRVRRLAMAASVLLALIVAGSLWVAAPHSSLAADVVAHMAGEPQAWARTDEPVPPRDLAPVLAEAHVRLEPAAGMVSYAQSCLFRGHHVPHLVVQTDAGPITVMVLVHESVRKAQPFDEEGYRGVIVPVAGHGSLAVLARGRDADPAAVEKIAARVRGAITWTH
jgi:uncharacterized protein DUF3379